MNNPLRYLITSVVIASTVFAVQASAAEEHAVVWRQNNTPVVNHLDAGDELTWYNLNQQAYVLSSYYSYADIDSYGNHACGVVTDGTIRCWTPNQVSYSMQFSQARKVSVGDHFVAALNNQGQVFVKEAGLQWTELFPGLTGLYDMDASSRSICVAYQNQPGMGMIQCKNLDTTTITNISTTGYPEELSVNETSIAFESPYGYTRLGRYTGWGQILSQDFQSVDEIAAAGATTCYLTTAGELKCEGALTGTWLNLNHNYEGLTVTTNNTGRDYAVVYDSFQNDPVWF